MRSPNGLLWNLLRKPHPEEVWDALVVYVTYAAGQAQSRRAKGKFIFKRIVPLYKHLMREGVFVGLVDCALRYCSTTSEKNRKDRFRTALSKSILHFSSESIGLGAGSRGGALGHPLAYEALFPRCASCIRRSTKRGDGGPPRTVLATLNFAANAPARRSPPWYLVALQSPRLSVHFARTYGPHADAQCEGKTESGSAYPDNEVRTKRACSEFTSECFGKAGVQSKIAVVPTLVSSCAAEEAASTLRRVFGEYVNVQYIVIVSPGACSCASSRVQQSGTAPPFESHRVCPACASDLVSGRFGSSEASSARNTLCFAMFEARAKDDERSFDASFDKLSRGVYDAQMSSELSAGEVLKRMMKQTLTSGAYFESFQHQMAYRSIHIKKEYDQSDPRLKKATRIHRVRAACSSISRIAMRVKETSAARSPASEKQNKRADQDCEIRFDCARAIFARFAVNEKCRPASRGDRAGLSDVYFDALMTDEYWMMACIARLQTIIRSHDDRGGVEPMCEYLDEYALALKRPFLERAPVSLDHGPALKSLDPNAQAKIGCRKRSSSSASIQWKKKSRVGDVVSA